MILESHSGEGREGEGGKEEDSEYVVGNATSLELHGGEEMPVLPTVDGIDTQPEGQGMRVCAL